MHFRSLFVLVSLLFTLSNINQAQAVNPNFGLEYDRLIQNYDNILDYKEVERCTNYRDEETRVCLDSEISTVYIYKTNELVNNVFSKNIKKFNNAYQIFSEDTFYNEGGVWYQIEKGYINREEFKTLQDSKLIDPLAKNNPFKIYSVNAETIYSYSSDGEIVVTGNGMADCKSKTSGTVDQTSTSNLMGWYEGGASDQLYRLYFSFDTSALDETKIVGTSSLFLYQTSSFSGVPYLTVVQFQGTTTAGLYPSNFDDIGTNAFNTSEAVVSANWNEFELNSTGTSTINLIGSSSFSTILTDDFTATGLGAHKYARFYSTDNAGTTYDPYLLVNLFAPETYEEEPATTTTILPSELIASDDLTIITGYTEHYETSTSAPDWYELHYYHIPALAIYLILALVIFIFSRIIIELIIRWR